MLSRRLIRIKAVKSLYAHISSSESSLIKSEKEYRTNIKKCYELYLMMLNLIVEVADYAEKRIEIGKAKMRPTPEEVNPNMRFVENRVVAIIRNSDSLNDALVRSKLSWRNEEALIKDFYKQMTESTYYQAYMNKAKSTFADDKRLVADFYRHHIEENELLEEALEEMSIFWSDDINYAASHAVDTITELQNSDSMLEVAQMYGDDESIVEFAETLYRKALVNSHEYFELIEKLAENWDFDRIALMDRIIMLAAITELTQFPSIPVKVTLDEYIEISKYYSTQGSSTFINGIIDKAIATLTAEGKINKTGRGLLDS